MSSYGHSRSNKLQETFWFSSYSLLATWMSSCLGVHLLQKCVSCFKSVQTQIVLDGFSQLLDGFLNFVQHQPISDSNSSQVCFFIKKNDVAGQLNQCKHLPFCSYDVHKKAGIFTISAPSSYMRRESRKSNRIRYSIRL